MKQLEIGRDLVKVVNSHSDAVSYVGIHVNISKNIRYLPGL